MIGKSTGRIFQLGEKVEVVVTGVNKMTKTIDFEMKEFYWEEEDYGEIGIY